MGDISFYGGGRSGGGGVDSFRIVEFTNDREWNQVGVPVVGVNFEWSLSGGNPTSQSISPLVGEVLPDDRSIFLGGLNITTDTTFTLTAVGAELTKAAITAIKFYHPIYIGLVENETPNENEILLTEKRIAPDKSFVHDFVIDDKRIAIAIHNSLPLLKDVKEMVLGMSVMDNFNVFYNVPVSVDSGVQNYNVYIYNSVQNTAGLHQQFNFVW